MNVSSPDLISLPTTCQPLAAVLRSVFQSEPRLPVEMERLLSRLSLRRPASC